MTRSDFDLAQELKQHDDPLGLIDQHINPAFATVLRTIGFDVRYVRGQGANAWPDSPWASSKPLTPTLSRRWSGTARVYNRSLRMRFCPIASYNR